MPILAAEEAEKLRAFEQRMQTEGVAAFAAGPAPWEQWDDTGTLGTYRVWMDHTRHTTPAARPPRKPLSTRLLTGATQLALLALLVGSTGVYLSIITPPQRVAGSGVQPPPILLADRAAPRPVTAAAPVIRSRAPALAAAAGPDTAPEAVPDESETPIVLAGAVVPLELETEPEQVPATPAALPDRAAEDALAMALAALPDTAAGPATTPAAVTASAPPAAAESAPAVQDTPAAEPPQLLALLTPAIDALPDKPAGRPAPAQAARELTDTWVINLAAYNYESMARHKLDAFRDKGVNAELVKITVRDKPMFRIRATGYQSRREAVDWIPLLEERLELKGTWVAKYEPGEESPASHAGQQRQPGTGLSPLHASPQDGPQRSRPSGGT